MKYDLYLAPGSGSKPLGFGYASSVKVTGNTKLAQRFIKFLLTPTGSEAVGATSGTGLPSLIGSNVNDQAFLKAALAKAVDDAATQVKAITGAADDARLENARILRLEFGVDRVDVYVEVVSTDGTATAISLPVNLGSATISSYGSALQGL